MSVGILDSEVFGGLWTSRSLGPLFDERARMAGWLEVLAVLAEVEGVHGLVPADAARDVAATCRAVAVDAAFLGEVRRGREATGHSTAGLLRAVAARCPGRAGEWVHFGATVQDVSDTWLAHTLVEARSRLEAELGQVEASLAGLARRHRDTPMLGRTHGQQGLPITFGFKAAGWGAELSRHLDRLRAIAPRLAVGQLSGGVGSLSALGPRGLEVQAAFCRRLGLAPPPFSWTASRDVLAEWGQVLTLVCGTADRIGHEVYELSRNELGELSEAAPEGVIGSITMPQKRNPERAEHLGTLSRLVRHLAAALAEGLVHDHERDGRAWKVEWHAVPELTVMAGRAVELLRELVDGLEVHPERMRANLDATGGLVLAEALMLAAAGRTGRETAHRLVSAAAAAARERGLTLAEAARASPELAAALPGPALDAALDPARQTGLCGALVDRWLASRSGP